MSNFERLKNREDSSDFDDSWTKLIAATGSIFSKISAPSKKSSHRQTDFASTSRKFLKNEKSGRRDRFRPKIVEIGAILAIFEPFEVWKIHMPLFGEFGRSSRDLYRNPLRIELSPGRLSKFLQKWRVRFSGKSGCWYDDVMMWWYDDMMIWWDDDMVIWWYDDMMIRWYENFPPGSGHFLKGFLLN